MTTKNISSRKKIEKAFNKLIESNSLKVWKKTHKGNYVLQNPGGSIYISYNESQNETALCVKTYPGGPVEFYILKGNFTNEYSKVFDQGYPACMKVYKKHKTHYRSDWSTDESGE